LHLNGTEVVTSATNPVMHIHKIYLHIQPKEGTQCFRGIWHSPLYEWKSINMKYLTLFLSFHFGLLRGFYELSECKGSARNI